MPTISSNDIKNGTVIQLDGKLLKVIWFQHHKPGKGNTVIRLKMKDLMSGSTIERTINADSKIEQAVVERREMSYLYSDGGHWHFMDSKTYEQLAVNESEVEDAKGYLTENLQVTLTMYEGRPIGVDLPASVDMKITESDPGVKGDRVSGATKPATLETGLIIQVPLFVGPGETIKVDTRSGEYITRVS
jgi:elongation factor P